MPFKIEAPYKPAGDQPEAIQQLTEGILEGEKHQVLLGVTGSGKTFTIANVIQNIRPHYLERTAGTHHTTEPLKFYYVLIPIQAFAHFE